MLVTLRILRKEYGCTLPVEVFSFPGEIEDMDMLEELRSLGVSLKIVCLQTHSFSLRRPYSLQQLAQLNRTKLRKWKNFQIKADAIVYSSFEEVLYLDSDNVPLRDPTYLFESELYNEHGVVFWPDLNKDHRG